MGRSNTIFKGNVNKLDFENWNNCKEYAKLLFVGYEGEKQVAKFYTMAEAERKISEEPDYQIMKDDFEEDSDELFHYYGFYFNSEDFYDVSSEDSGVFDVTPVNEVKLLLTVTLNI